MNKQRMKEELARIERYEAPFTFGVPDRGFVSHRLHGVRNGRCIQCPDYLHPEEGYGHMHRIINAMNEEQLGGYDWALGIMIMNEVLEDVHLVSVIQMAESILRAYGKFDEN